MDKLYDKKEQSVNVFNANKTKKVNKKFIERKKELNESVKLYMQDARLNKTDRAILAYLSKSWAMDIGRFKSTIRKYQSIQDAVERGYHAVYRSLKKLQKIGFLKIEQRKQNKNKNIQACNRYILIPKQKNAKAIMQGRVVSDKPTGDKGLLVSLQALPISLSFKNHLYNTCIKNPHKNVSKNKKLNVRIDELVDTLNLSDKKAKKQKMYLQYAAKMCKYMLKDNFDDDAFLNFVHNHFLKLFKPRKYRTYKTHNHLLSALITDFCEQIVGGCAYKLRDWYNLQNNKKMSDNHQLQPAFGRKPISYD